MSEAHTAIAQMIARDVEASACLARQYGFLFPKSYDLGVMATWPTCMFKTDHRLPVSIRVRLNEFVKRFTLELNDLNPMAFRDKLASQTGQFVMEYLDAHPELKDKGKMLQLAEVMTKRRDYFDAEVEKRATAALAKARFTLVDP